MDYLELVDDIEFDFTNLLQKGYPAKMFERNAKLILGDNWKEDGKDLLKEHAPELLPKFNEYVLEGK